MTATIEDDRDTVRRLLLEAESQIRQDPDAADATTTAAQEIVDRWRTDGKAADLLSPLLTDAEQEPVRFGAASYLLNHGHADLAVPALEKIEMPEAWLALRKWRNQQE